jgi:hypothetical protein
MTDLSATIADAWARERELFRAVVRWRALYSRMRPRMEEMGHWRGGRLHNRLKDAEYAAIEDHQAAERFLNDLAAQAGLARLSGGYQGRMC